MVSVTNKNHSEEQIMNLSQAEQGIANILKQLEESTGELVSSIGLKEIDVTSVDDVGRRVLISPVIYMHRTPAHSWPTEG